MSYLSALLIFALSGVIGWKIAIWSKNRTRAIRELKQIEAYIKTREQEDAKTVRVWIDDVRPAPEGWLWAHTSQIAIAIIEGALVRDPGASLLVSFDHDLGGDDTAMPVARMIEEGAHDGSLPPIQWTIHSANPVGRLNLTAALESADRFWVMRTT